ncbi:hypothetical protein FJU08_17615, partial [Martelella alba]
MGDTAEIISDPSGWFSVNGMDILAAPDAVAGSYPIGYRVLRSGKEIFTGAKTVTITEDPYGVELDGGGRIWPGVLANINAALYRQTALAAGSIPAANDNDIWFPAPEVDLAEILPLERLGVSTYTGADGLIHAAAVDTARLDWQNGKRQLVIEGESTNVITRSSPTALLPWNDGAVSNGITVTVVGYGMLGDMPYVDYALTGTATANQCGAFAQTGLSNAAAVAGETWTASIYTQLISGEWPAGIILGSGVYEQQDNTYLTGTGPGEVPVASLTRLSRTRTLTEAATNLVRSAIQVANMTAGVTTFNGQVVRLAGWSLEKKPGPTSLIQTLSDAAVTRAEDDCRLSDKAVAILNRDQWTMLLDCIAANVNDGEPSV